MLKTQRPIGVMLLAAAALVFGGLGLYAAAGLSSIGTPEANTRFLLPSSMPR